MERMTSGHKHGGRSRCMLAVMGCLAVAGAASGQCFEAELIPADAEHYDMVGWCVQIAEDGDLAAVTSYAQEEVYIFEKSGDDWVETATVPFISAIIPGRPIALHPGGDEFACARLSTKGQLVIYRRQGGDWLEQPPLGEIPTRSQTAICYSGDGNTLVYGGGGAIGEVHIYHNQGGFWQLEALLTGDDLSDDNRLGSTLAVSNDGETIAAGAFMDDEGRGCVRIYRLEAGSWILDTQLEYPDVGQGNRFGVSLAMNAAGDVLFIGSGGEKSNPDSPYRVYRYDKTGNEWTPTQTLLSPTGSSKIGFADFTCCSADASTLVIADTMDSDAAPYAGAVYLYRSAGDEYAMMHKLVLENAHPLDSFGYPIDLTADGATLIAGAPFGGTDQYGDDYTFGTGAAYIINVDECAPDFASMGDLDGDYDIDDFDLGILLNAYEKSPEGDVDGDGDTDQHDLGILLKHYGRML